MSRGTSGSSNLPPPCVDKVATRQRYGKDAALKMARDEMDGMQMDGMQGRGMREAEGLMRMVCEGAV